MADLHEGQDPESPAACVPAPPAACSPRFLQECVEHSPSPPPRPGRDALAAPTSAPTFRAQMHTSPKMTISRRCHTLAELYPLPLSPHHATSVGMRPIFRRLPRMAKMRGPSF